MRRGMYSKLICLSLMPLSVLFFLVYPTAYAAKKPSPPKPTLTLNLQQGPLGVTLTLSGKNLHPGEATISFVDAKNMPGIFIAPSDNKVQVRQNGSFVSTNVILPNNGPAGIWNIVVVDSAQATLMVRYRVLTPSGSAPAGVPTLTINPSIGKIGDLIAFSGNNWLPGGTRVKLLLVTDTATIPLINTPVKSDKNGVLMGAFRVPTTIAPAQTLANLSAVDASGALRAQAQLTLTSLMLTPTVSSQSAMSAAPSPTPGTSTTITIPDSLRQLSQLNDSSLLLIILLIGGTLGLAGLMLLLFLLPARSRHTNRHTPTAHVDIQQTLNYTMPKRNLYSYSSKKELHGR